MEPTDNHDHSHGLDEACDCGHHHHHDDNCGCGHHHHHDDHDAKTISTNVGGGVALCRSSSHEGAHIVSCSLELENATLSASCLANVLRAVASDMEKLGGIVGHIKCAAAEDGKSLRISTTQAGLEPTLVIDGLKDLTDESEINIAVIVFGVEHGEIIDSLLTRLEQVF